MGWPRRREVARQAAPRSPRRGHEASATCPRDRALRGETGARKWAKVELRAPDGTPSVRRWRSRSSPTPAEHDRLPRSHQDDTPAAQRMSHTLGRVIGKRAADRWRSVDREHANLEWLGGRCPSEGQSKNDGNRHEGSKHGTNSSFIPSGMLRTNQSSRIKPGTCAKSFVL